MRKRGFTLIELAVVLLIVGLLAAGVVAATGMRAQSARQAALSEIDRYAKAIQLFSDKYGQYPGDFTGAEAAWGTDGGGCPAAFNTVPKQATCNGDGNGTIGSWDGATFGNTQEWYRAWQHLANAGMLEGKFTGAGGNVAGSRLINMAIPGSRMEGGGYTLLFEYYAAVTADNFPMSGQHVLLLGAVNPGCAGGATAASCITSAPLLTPADALEFDQKVDDGRPGTGRMMARPQGSALTPNCATTAVTTTATYDATRTTRECSLVISTGN